MKSILLLFLLLFTILYRYLYRENSHWQIDYYHDNLDSIYNQPLYFSPHILENDSILQYIFCIQKQFDHKFRNLYYIFFYLSFLKAFPVIHIFYISLYIYQYTHQAHIDNYYSFFLKNGSKKDISPFIYRFYT